MVGINRCDIYSKANWYMKKFMFEEALIEMKKIDFSKLNDIEKSMYCKAMSKLSISKDINRFNGELIDTPY